MPAACRQRVAVHVRGYEINVHLHRSKPRAEPAPIFFRRTKITSPTRNHARPEQERSIPCVLHELDTWSVMPVLETPLNYQRLVRAVAKGSDRTGNAFHRWRESRERRFDGFASLAVKGRSRRPTWNESGKTFGIQYMSQLRGMHVWML
jgi:hypothetical protein